MAEEVFGTQLVEHPRSWISKNYKSFNGLRGLAILSVFVGHYGTVALPAYIHDTFWWVGVDLFFVLSGFLITGVLYRELESPRFFRDFYIRRGLRILPLYYGLFLAIFLLTKPLHLEYPPSLWLHLAYIQNVTYRHILVVSQSPGGHLGLNAVNIGRHHHAFLQLLDLWSLCAEEQFYLLWPLVVWLVRSRKGLIFAALTGAVAVLLLRCGLVLFDHYAVLWGNYIYHESFARADGMFLGAALNLWLQKKRLTRGQLRNRAFWGAAICLGALVTVWCAYGRNYGYGARNPVIQTVGFTLIDATFACLILWALDEGTVFGRFLQLSWLSRLGTISYGFYVLHNLARPVYVRLADRPFPHHTRPLVAVAVFAIAYCAASLSFRFWESPFLRLKDRLAPSHRSVPSGREATFTETLLT